MADNANTPSTVNDGGPAFPTEHVDTGYQASRYRPHPGMSLRDYFAGQALIGLLAGRTRNSYPDDFAGHAFACAAFACADAMLARKAVSHA